MDIPSMIIGAGIAMLLANLWVWYGLPRWHARGRHRLQCRTEARLREDRLQALAKWKQAHPEQAAEWERIKGLVAWRRAQRANGATSPERTRGTPSEPRQ